MYKTTEKKLNSVFLIGSRDDCLLDVEEMFLAAEVGTLKSRVSNFNIYLYIYLAVNI